MINFVGDKKLFGIEFLPIEKFLNKRGNIKIWINCFSIGNPLDDDFFFIIVNQLNHIAHNSKYYVEIENKSDREILEMMLEDDGGAGKYDSANTQLGESFDDYVIKAFLTVDKKMKILVAAKDIQLDSYNIISVLLERDYLEKLINSLLSRLKSIPPQLE